MKTINTLNKNPIPAARGMITRTMANNHEQIMRELNRLEREKVHLERVNSVWLSYQEKQLTRIQMVQDRMELLRGKIENLLPIPQVPLENRDSHAAQSGEVMKNKSRNFRKVELEY